MAGPNVQNAGWQNYTPNPNPQYVVSGSPVQNGFGQNGGYMMAPTQPEMQFVGRFINQIEDVMPKEVPMDGRPAIFPTQSLNEIYLKAWDRYGTIKTFRYILDPDQNLNVPPPQQGADMQSQILSRLDDLEKKLSEGQQNKLNQRTNSKGGEK